MVIEIIIVSSVLIAFTLIVSIIPAIYSAVKKFKILKPVEYMPPRGASPVDILIGYYGASANAREIFNSLMLYWASRGFITIEEDCKRGLKLTKIKDLERPESDDGFNPNTFKMEKELFNYIFCGSAKTFYTLSAHISFNEFYAELTNTCRKQAQEISEIKSQKFSIISCLTSFVMLLGVTLVVGISSNNDTLLMMLFPLFSIVVSKLVISFGIKKGKNYATSSETLIFFLICLMVGSIPAISVFWTVPLDVSILILVALLVCIINVYFLSSKVDIRTDEQLKTYARICGFKKFLLRAEIRQLEALVEDDPQYYYNILPYCYVLRITEKLKPKFDRIALDGPAWYLGDLRETLMF